MDKPYDQPPLEEIDEAIRPLVEALNQSQAFCTWGSCEGHAGHEFHPQTYVGIAAKGLDAVQLLVEALNAIQSEFESADDPLLIECNLNWSWDVGASTDLRNIPDWLSFEIRFESVDGEAIGPKRLQQIADIFQKHLDEAR